ncbi:MAG: alpha/beta hydrolase [Bacteroidota bacterium]
MKKLKQVIADIKSLLPTRSASLDGLLAEYLFYSPKMPLRLAAEQLLDRAEKGSVVVYDEYFSGEDLKVNTFKWGRGNTKIFLTHGWGSKAADFGEIITALLEVEDVEVIAFDAPGNGSSEGGLSNLLLYILAFEAAVAKYGEPDVVIGHSLGTMANAAALSELGLVPKLLVSLTPLVLLKENFEASMNAIGVDEDYQVAILDNFAEKFKVPASYFTLDRFYDFNETLNHWIFYDSYDLISPFEYLKPFLDKHAGIKTKKFDGAGHERILKSPEMIGELVKLIRLL